MLVERRVFGRQERELHLRRDLAEMNDGTPLDEVFCDERSVARENSRDLGRRILSKLVGRREPLFVVT